MSPSMPGEEEEEGGHTETDDNFQNNQNLAEWEWGVHKAASGFQQFQKIITSTKMSKVKTQT